MEFSLNPFYTKSRPAWFGTSDGSAWHAIFNYAVRFALVLAAATAHLIACVLRKWDYFERTVSNHRTTYSFTAFVGCHFVMLFTMLFAIGLKMLDSEGDIMEVKHVAGDMMLYSIGCLVLCVVNAMVLARKYEPTGYVGYDETDEMEKQEVHGKRCE
ncbi:hypothetical protein LTR17_011971 [Elasticomyces elasticus]|nr:hypothetical protein LTR17_011971 [Elasticomyces elasticus]